MSKWLKLAASGILKGVNCIVLTGIAQGHQNVLLYMKYTEVFEAIQVGKKIVI